MPLRIYLDTSVYNRPFDDQQQPRIWLETMAFLVILQMFEAGAAVLVTSAIVGYETSKNPHQERKTWVRRITRLASESVQLTPSIRREPRSWRIVGSRRLMPCIWLARNG